MFIVGLLMALIVFIGTLASLFTNSEGAGGTAMGLIFSLIIFCIASMVYEESKKSNFLLEGQQLIKSFFDQIRKTRYILKKDITK
jgi:hypothetical protein